MNHLIQMINSGALDKIDQTIERLVQLQANVGFKLISKDDNQQNNDSQNSKDSIFRLVYYLSFWFFFLSFKYLDYYFELNMHGEKIQ